MHSDVVPFVDVSGQAVAWAAVVTSLVALGKQGYDIIRNRKREHDEIEEALDRQPLVREQLELGNTRAAIEQLTAIIDTMAQAKKRDDEAARKRIAELEAREDQLEREAREREAQHRLAEEQWERRYNRLDERCRKITAVLRRHNWEVDDG